LLIRVEETDPPKQGLKLASTLYGHATVDGRRDRSTKTRIETLSPGCLHSPVSRVEETDPPKQGLKPYKAEAKGIRVEVEETDPPKQGLKRISSFDICYTIGLSKRPIHQNKD